MKLILLSGQSLPNKDWIEEVNLALKPEFTDSEILYYKHWENGEGKADVALESERLVELVNKIEGDYFIFAKSIGTVITFNSLARFNRPPVGAVFVGVPYHLAKETGSDFTRLKDLASFPINVYQKDQDPFCSYEDLKVIEGGSVTVNKYEADGEENDNHHYASMDYLREIVGNTISLR